MTAMKIEDVKALVAIATDEDRGGRERLAAFEQADEGRKALKVGWSKLGLTVEQVEGLKADLPALAALDDDETERDEALGEAPTDDPEPEASEATETDGDEAEEPFEASEAELEKQTGRKSKAEAEDRAALERAAKKASKAKAEGAGETRGGLTRLIESLLMDAGLSYLDILNAVLKEFPKANTSARSIASVAAGMRRAGKPVPMRRPVKAEKPAKPAEAPAEAEAA